MIVKGLSWTIRSAFFTTQPSYTIISKLFQKKNQEEAKPKEGTSKAAEQTDKEKEIQIDEDEEYNFFERRKEIDTSFDFLKLKQLNNDIIPENLGVGGLQQVLYWSQIAKSPEQIHEVLVAFNRTATTHPHQVPSILSSVHLSQFKASLVSTVYLANSFHLLRQYALFGYKFNMEVAQLWEKVQYKAVRLFPKTGEEKNELVDITFLMSQLQKGQAIYHQVQKLLFEEVLTPEQYVKLFIAFSALQKGEKSWIQKLVQALTQNIHELDAQQLTTILPHLKMVKKTPVQLNPNIIARATLLMDSFTLHQLLNLTDYLGFQTEDSSLWRAIQQRADVLLKGKKIGVKLYQQLILKAMLTYRLSVEFIRKFILSPLHKKDNDLIAKLRPQTLSALAKSFYLYEMEQQSKQFTEPIGESVISKITQGINDISDEELVAVIQDYNLSRHGHRQLYIFLEEVIKMKYISRYDPELDRNIVEKIISIYDNSGMCSQEMYTSLKALIMQ